MANVHADSSFAKVNPATLPPVNVVEGTWDMPAMPTAEQAYAVGRELGAAGLTPDFQSLDDSIELAVWEGYRDGRDEQTAAERAADEAADRERARLAAAEPTMPERRYADARERAAAGVIIPPAFYWTKHEQAAATNGHRDGLAARENAARPEDARSADLARDLMALVAELAGRSDHAALVAARVLFAAADDVDVFGCRDFAELEGRTLAMMHEVAPCDCGGR